MAITPESLSLAARIRRDAAGVTDRAMHDLAIALATAWDEVAQDLQAALDDLIAAAEDGKVTQSRIARSTRLNAALGVITDRLDQVMGETETRVIGDLRGVLEQALATQEQLFRSQLPPNITDTDFVRVGIVWDRVDADSINWIVERTTQQVHAKHLPLTADAEAVMKREIVRGLAGGVNPRQTASRIMGRVQREFYGGHARAERIARTETLDALRAATKAAEQRNTHVLQEWMWLASLGARTCPACWGMHGTRHPLDEDGPIDHQNGRCTRVTVTRSWRDLGFDIPEPPDVTPDAAATFDALEPAQQRSILGPDRYAAYAAGDYPISSWAARRENSGWRDSITVSPAPR